MKGMQAALVLSLQLLLQLAAGAASEQAAALPEHSPGHEFEDSYKQAVQIIRTHPTVGWNVQQKAVNLLVKATGFKSKVLGASFPFNCTTAATHVPLGSFGEQVQLVQDFHPGAARELGKAFQTGFGVKTNFILALELFRAAADAGDAEAHGHMGLRYAFGLDEPLSWTEDSIARFGEPNDGKAVLHYYFGAAGGDSFSRLVLGYRHLQGHSVPKSCWTAASYYQPVAELVSDLSTQPSSLPQLERIRLHSQASQGLKADRHKEVIQYYQYSADRGNIDAQTAVGQVLNYGTHGVQRDHEQALHYLKQAAAGGDAEAMAHLGHMYANGLGTARSFSTAVEWWQKAARRNNPNALYGLGYTYLTARGVQQDHDRAFKYFSQAAEGGHADALFYMGVMHLKGLGVRRKSVQRAFSYFTLASHAGHVLAMYNAAMMHMGGKGTPKNCKPAIKLLKQLGEKSPAVAVVQEAHESFFRGSYQLALLQYLYGAELGNEMAQANAAWMLDRGYATAGSETEPVSYRMYQRSAEQGNIHSLLRLGDALFYGRGVDQDWVRASAVYYEAYQERSAEAMFNLGFMHEFGAGVPQDLKLARRFYAMAQHTQADAYAPVYIALGWLKLHEWWEALRPHLPSRLDWLWNQVLALRAPHTSVLGPWADNLSLSRMMPDRALMHAEVLFWQWVDAIGIRSMMARLSAALASDVDDDDGSGAGSEGGGSGSGAASGDEDEDADGDLMTLLVMLGVLAFVIHLRRRRAAQRQQPHPGQGAGAPGQQLLVQALLQEQQPALAQALLQQHFHQLNQPQQQPPSQQQQQHSGHAQTGAESSETTPAPAAAAAIVAGAAPATSHGSSSGGTHTQGHDSSMAGPSTAPAAAAAAAPSGSRPDAYSESHASSS